MPAQLGMKSKWWIWALVLESKPDKRRISPKNRPLAWFFPMVTVRAVDGSNQLMESEVCRKEKTML